MDLRTALRQSGVQPVKDAASATVIIDLATVEYTRAVKSVDSQGTATGYTLEYEVLYRVVDRLGRVLVENTSLSFTRDLVYKSTELLQKKQEEEALKISMRQEIVRRIIRRLAESRSIGKPGRGPVSFLCSAPRPLGSGGCE